MRSQCKVFVFVEVRKSKREAIDNKKGVVLMETIAVAMYGSQRNAIAYVIKKDTSIDVSDEAVEQAWPSSLYQASNFNFFPGIKKLKRLQSQVTTTNTTNTTNTRILCFIYEFIFLIDQDGGNWAAAYVRMYNKRAKRKSDDVREYKKRKRSKEEHQVCLPHLSINHSFFQRHFLLRKSGGKKLK